MLDDPGEDSGASRAERASHLIENREAAQRGDHQHAAQAPPLGFGAQLFDGSGTVDHALEPRQIELSREGVHRSLYLAPFSDAIERLEKWRVETPTWKVISKPAAAGVHIVVRPKADDSASPNALSTYFLL